MLGTKLRQLRNIQGYTQDYVAEEIGVSQSNYSRMESDEFQPNSDLLPKLSKLYDVPIQDFFSDTRDRYINISQYSDQSFSAYKVYQDSQKYLEKIVETKDELIASLRSQLEHMQEENRRLKDLL